MACMAVTCCNMVAAALRMLHLQLACLRLSPAVLALTALLLAEHCHCGRAKCCIDVIGS
jgi:hypothetical protein